MESTPCKNMRLRFSHIKQYIIAKNPFHFGTEYCKANEESYFQTVKGVVECLKVMTDKNAERLARYAFAYAKRNGRKKITTIHKANIM